MSSQHCSTILLAAIEELDACPAAQATEVLRWVGASNPDAARKAAEGILQALLDNARATEQATHAQLRSIEAKLSADVAKIEERVAEYAGSAAGGAGCSGGASEGA